MFEALEWYVRHHDAKLEELTLQEQLQLPAAKEAAVIAAVTEAIFSPDINKIKRLGPLLGITLWVRRERSLGESRRIHKSVVPTRR